MWCAVIVMSALIGALRAAGKTLDIYFIDVEGGQATLIVLPQGRTLLVDTGYPSDGKFQSRPGDPRSARDAQRILAAARNAGASRIDTTLRADVRVASSRVSRLRAFRHRRCLAAASFDEHRRGELRREPDREPR